MPRPEKEAAVREIADRFNEVDAALLTEFRGLSVTDIAEVRGALRDAGADYKVLKNTLARIAVKEAGLDELVEMFQGPTAVAFVKGDAVEAAKALDGAAGRFPVLVIKGGMLRGGRVIGAEEARRLARLESREVVLTQIVTMINQPAQRTVNVLSALLRDLGSMLAQVLTQKEESGEPAGAAPAQGAADEAGAEEPAEAAAEDTAAGTDDREQQATEEE